MENLLFLGIPILKHIRVCCCQAVHRADKYCCRLACPKPILENFCFIYKINMKSVQLSSEKLPCATNELEMVCDATVCVLSI